MTLDGIQRGVVPHPIWIPTTKLHLQDDDSLVDQIIDAFLCYKSQLRPEALARLHKMTKGEKWRIWGQQTFYRSLSLVNAGQDVLEQDLFEGL